MTDSERYAALFAAFEATLDIANEAIDVKDIRGIKGMDIRHKLRKLERLRDYERERLNEECEVKA
jgi:hypothetical protein